MMNTSHYPLLIYLYTFKDQEIDAKRNVQILHIAKADQTSDDRKGIENMLKEKSI